ncbi:hypothetical protein N5U00_10630 [Aliarcobacter butzleri]|uniref:hypothetical protein n=1 Tax=Aliarcobacter butzleri TaxID=28197 RepID=UPI0021B3D884|nr:hypothetical protein [Aliarcobacter butzleri]MCT7570402.1 hypothetical protein [Aliarcobacter butzleri]MCT7572850.1 hypothetical protein [Aliarcobacter butzleri]MCT7575785.1 hypothetical protein [Aliarcobacter butzleri]MCT7579849.1 hypothetical protein [Aliarcobacter butzleri]
MEESTFEFKILFSKAKEMNILGIEECKPNNIFCLVKKIEFYLFELNKGDLEKLKIFIKLCNYLKEKQLLNELKDFLDNLDKVSLEIAKNNIKQLIEEEEEVSFHFLR